jgi:butyrate kinase
MPPVNGRILAINPGATSTKIGVYSQGADGEAKADYVETVRHPDEELAPFEGQSVQAQRDYRIAQIKATLAKGGFANEKFVAVVGRGGLLPPVPSGTMLVDATLLEELRLARRGDHASNLGGVLASAFAKEAGVNAYIVDPVSVDEREDIARLSGMPEVPRNSFCHALNTKAIAKRYAHEQHQSYDSLRLIVIHLGSGNSISAHRDGRMLDNNSGEEGPFGVDRSGSVPMQPLIKLCFSGNYNEKQIMRKAQGEGGVLAYLGTRDMVEVERRIAAGDKQAETVYEAMLYQVAKEAGGMAVVLKGKVDAILLTGGMAYSKAIVARLTDYLSWIAPVKAYPGEDELLALAEGTFRVLSGEEQPKTLQPQK